MATRSLTDVFMLMRNNAVRNRHIYAEQENSERMSLVALNDAERGIELRNDSRMPPPWVDQLEEVQFTLTKLRAKINELKMLHSRYLHRPTLDESSEEEVLIENLTSEITSMFNSVHRLIQHIKSHHLEGTRKEQRLTSNVVRSVISSLQELSNLFRTTQSSYLKQIHSREERSKIYFENPALQNDYGMLDTQDNIDEFFVNSRQSAQQQLLFLEEENVQVASQREQEVNNIVKSIVDLNDIFKDLAHMVSDQGTILDRIDFNIEQTQTQVYEGYKQLQKADAYQRKNRKMCCILVLAATTILLVFILIVVKS